MKKIKFSIIALFIAAVAFTSCDNEITPDTIAAPVISFTEGDASILTGEAVSVSGTIFAEGELDQVVIKQNVDGTITTLSDDNSFDVNTSHDFLFDFVDVTESFSITVEATDKEDQTRSKTATITVTVPETVVKTTSAIKLYSAPADKFGDESRFASLTPDFTTYTWATAQGNEAMVDILYYNGNYTKASIPHFVSANVATDFTHDGDALTGDNTTYFAVLTGDDAALFTDWANINDDTAINSIAATIAETNVTWTDAAETFVAFELSNGKKGVIKVGAAVDGNSNGTFYDSTEDYIEFDVMVQLNAPVTK